MKNSIEIETRPLSFNKRLFHSMLNPWLWISILLIAFTSLDNPFILALAPTLFTIFLLINVRAQTFNIERIRSSNSILFIDYSWYNHKAKPLEIEFDQLAFEYYGHTKGPTAGDHLRIGTSNHILLKQYTNKSWTLNQLRELAQQLETAKSNQ